MARTQSAALDRKKLMADPVMVGTIVVLITFLTLFILYPLAILLVDSFYAPKEGGVTLSIFRRVMAMANFRTAIGNTLKVGFLVGILHPQLGGVGVLGALEDGGGADLEGGAAGGNHKLDVVVAVVHDLGDAVMQEADADGALAGSGPSKNVGTGECTIGIGFLHDGITQIVDNGYDNIELVIPSSGTSFEIGATAIFKGAKHPNAAKLWVEYALSPDCVNQAKDFGSYQFLVIDNAEQPQQAADFGLDPNNVMDYDFEDAKNNIKTYVEEVMTALGSAADGRFQTE